MFRGAIEFGASWFRIKCDNLETARARGIEGMSAARLDVRTRTQGAKPPGAAPHILKIRVEKFGDKPGRLSLDYAADEARGFAIAPRESQTPAPGKPSLHADVKVDSLIDGEAEKNAISDALDRLAACGFRRARRARHHLVMPMF